MINNPSISVKLKTLFLQMESEGYINIQKHPTAQLYIYNYTVKTQFEWKWNEATRQARGLILDLNDCVIARPFPKFFNLSEHQSHEIPNESFDVFEKMDGSLGILYFINNQPFIATRGSFTSKQAKKANDLLYSKYVSTFQHLKQDRTYLFEIIYPQNRIVVDYGTVENLYLLAIIDHETGRDLPLENIGFPIVKHYNGINDLSTLQDLAQKNKEGFVIKFQSGFRVKVKFEEYKRLHYILSRVSSVTIWETLKASKTLDDILHLVPDEFYDWVRQTERNFRQQYQTIETTAKQEFKTLNTRKETAAYFNTCTYPTLLFSMLDNKDYTDKIWQMIRPSFEKPFANPL